MSRHFGVGYTYHSGCGGPGRSAAGILTDRQLAERKVDHALIGVLEAGAWRPEIRVAWSGVAACRVSDPSPAWVIVGHGGQALVVDGAGHRAEAIGDGPDAATRTGLLRGGRAIEGRAYAVGMERQVWRRDGRGLWTRIDQGCRLALGDPTVTGLEAIDGPSADELWAAGWRGEVWRCRQGVWQLVPTPTNLILTNLCCAPDGRVYVCGRRGMLLVAADDRIERVDQEATTDDFWGIAWHEETLYLATFHDLYRYRPTERRLEPVDDEDSPSSCYHLSAADGRLWSFGPFEVAVLEQGRWIGID